ncbi:hypothetical protein C2869_01995 [Saccharobesus litoralis]|uniref:BIG2 domain-containing protein n=1 Tax=Saccharobesus litoralis TaxID=2172099 RepID=A0A2S0VMG3_9ALTE|nr:Ig-like domain-containing protein [Saccharobesus litoralis]AWB65290.1 hypothetical protein C2869_01995 [Saccharobesus litoralis]
MNNNIKASMLAMLIAALTAGCNEDFSSNVDGSQIEPVTLEVESINIVVSEDDDIKRVSLLADIVNTGGRVFARNFEYKYLTDDDGIKLPTEPALPNGGVTKELEEIIITPSLWTDQLVYGETVSYRFRYDLDNGSDTTVERWVNLTVNGAETKVTDIDVLADNSFELPVGISTKMRALVSPVDATFPEITWTSSDNNIASFSGDILTTKATGDVAITATSADGLVVKTNDLSVVSDSNKPTGVAIVDDADSEIEVIRVEEGETLSLKALLNFKSQDNSSNTNLIWSSDDETKLTVDAQGKATGVIGARGATAVKVVTEEQGLGDIVRVQVVPNSNALFSKNGNFEFSADSIAPWVGYWQNASGGATVTVKEEAASAGMYGIHIQSPGTKNTGITLSPDEAPQLLGLLEDKSNFGKTYRVKFDAKTKVGTRIGFVEQIMQGQNPTRSFTKFTINNTWSTVTLDIPVKDIQDPNKSYLNSRFDIYFNAHGGGIDIFLDNISIRELN